MQLKKKKNANRFYFNRKIILFLNYTNYNKMLKTPDHHPQMKSFSNIKPTSPLFSSKKVSFFPPIKTQMNSYNRIVSREILNDDEVQESFNTKKKTIQMFLKNYDLNVININAKSQKQNLNLLTKNASLEAVNLSKKMFQNMQSVKKEKGSLLVNELWSHNYYKKVMKFSNLKLTMDNVLKFRRSKYQDNKKKMLNQQIFDEFNKKIDNFDSLSPFRVKRENIGTNRRMGVALMYF